MTVLRLGTRRSALARTQSEGVADLLRAAGHRVHLVEVVTEGDRSTAPLDQIGGTGVFVGALRSALRAGTVDLAVHSLKDLPTAPEGDLVVAAIPARRDPRDALVARDGLTLGELPTGARVGTGSPRRTAQLNALALGLEVVPVRGNVDTRLALVSAGELDAVVLAVAGLARLGRGRDIAEVLDPLQMLPAPGQGALALECRAADADVRAALAPLDDEATRACVTAERAVLSELEAGCTAPVGVLADLVEDETGLQLYVRAYVGALDGSDGLRRSLVGDVADADATGRKLAALLLGDGAAVFGIAPPPEQRSAAGSRPVAARDRHPSLNPTDTENPQ